MAVRHRPSVSKTLKLVAGIVALFTALVAAIIFLSASKVISFTAAILMLIALLGMYLGFGFLIAVYRFVGKLK